MPRNPNKTHCQQPGCRSWAMRGHTRCRAHRDLELGPRGAGAPRGNLNALKLGHHAHPLPPPDLQRLAHQIVQQPDHLPLHIGLAVQSLHSRTGDLFKTVLALQSLLPELVPLLAGHLLTAELDAFLPQLPPSRRHRVRSIFWKHALRLGPQSGLLFLRKTKKTITGKTIAGTGTPDQDAADW